MAVALRGSAAVPTGNPTTSFTVTIDAAVVRNDVLYLLVASRDSTGAGTLAVTDNDTGGNTWTKIAASDDHKLSLWFKRATIATASKTVTVSNAVGSTAGVLKAFSGASLSTPHSNIFIKANASGVETHPGFTPILRDTMICAGIVNYNNDNAVTSLSFATLGAATMTEKLSTGGSDCAAAFGHVLQTAAVAPATGTLTWAQTDGPTYSITWNIRPEMATVVQERRHLKVGSGMSRSDH